MHNSTVDPNTYLLLAKEQTRQLPPELEADDVRYPESLVEYFLHQYTREGDVVLDPFAGFGTTLLVAEALGRMGYGIEYDEGRCAYVQSQLQHPERLICGDARHLATYDLPLCDFTMTSPPYMARGDLEDPLTAYTCQGKGYDAYLENLTEIYRQLRTRMKDGAHAVIEAANLKGSAGVTTVAWDIARAVGRVLTFEGEIIIGWDRPYGYGYDHSYCLVFSRHNGGEAAECLSTASAS